MTLEQAYKGLEKRAHRTQGKALAMSGIGTISSSARTDGGRRSGAKAEKFSVSTAHQATCLLSEALKAHKLFKLDGYIVNDGEVIVDEFATVSSAAAIQRPPGNRGEEGVG
ncbi:MAG: hypothetical protein ACLS4Z_01685 [Christensenellaceae bacterium]